MVMDRSGTLERSLVICSPVVEPGQHRASFRLHALIHKGSRTVQIFTTKHHSAGLEMTSW